MKFGIGYKAGIPWKTERVCGHGAGSCVPSLTPGERLRWALSWDSNRFVLFFLTKRANAGL